MGLLAISLSVSKIFILPEVLGLLESVAGGLFYQCWEIIHHYLFRDYFCLILSLLLPDFQLRVHPLHLPSLL